VIIKEKLELAFTSPLTSFLVCVPTPCCVTILAFFIREWFIKGIRTIQQLFNENSRYLTFQEFQAKYHCNTNFLQFYQILSAISVRLRNRARALGQNLIFNCSEENWKSFSLSETSQINFEMYKARDYYRLLLIKKHQSPRTGPERCERDVSIDKENWTDVFKMASKTCKENKLKEFQFKFLHRVVITKKELFRYGINTDSDYVYSGEPDSINHTFIDCKFTKTLTCKIIDWCNTQNGSNFQPDTKETLFATFKHSTRMELVRKFNYTLLYMKFYVNVSKLNNSPLVQNEFITKINYKYKVEIL